MDGAMVFRRLNIGRVFFGRMLTLIVPSIKCLVGTLKFDRVLLVSSQMSGWSRHLCLVASLPIFRAYNELPKSGLRFALVALVSEL
jgi:hypothetical protein